jgi:ribosomal protein L10
MRRVRSWTVVWLCGGRRAAVPLTKVKVDRKSLKTGVIETIHQSVDAYTNLFVISFENLRSAKLKELRREWCDDSK